MFLGLRWVIVFPVCLGLLLLTAGFSFADSSNSVMYEVPAVSLRVERLGEVSVCDKYCWQEIRVLEVIQNKTDHVFPEVFSVAYYSWALGILDGVSVVFLERYNAQFNDLWKLTGVDRTGEAL